MISICLALEPAVSRSAHLLSRIEIQTKAEIADGSNNMGSRVGIYIDRGRRNHPL